MREKELEVGEGGRGRQTPKGAHEMPLHTAALDSDLYRPALDRTIAPTIFNQANRKLLLQQYFIPTWKQSARQIEGKGE